MSTHRSQLPRREFLQRSAAGLGGLLLGSSAAGAVGEALAPKFDATETVQLGQAKLSSSRLMLGTGMRGFNRESNHTRMGREKFSTLLRGAFDRGVRSFDLADLYGTHPYIVPALDGIPRSDYQLVTKIWFRDGGLPEDDRPDADVAVERFLREIKTDYIDLLLIHCVTSPDWPTELARQMEIISRLKEKGVVRAHGVSVHSLPALKRCIDEPWVESVHTRINPYGMSMDGSPEEVVPVIQGIHAAGKGIVGMKVVGAGKLRNDRDRRADSVKFSLGLGCVDVLNVGCETLGELDDMSELIHRVPKVA